MSKLVDEGPGDIVLNALPYEMSSAGLAFHKGCLSTAAGPRHPGGEGRRLLQPGKTVRPDRKHSADRRGRPCCRTP